MPPSNLTQDPSAPPSSPAPLGSGDLNGLASLLVGEQAAFLDDLYQVWLSDPSAVDAAWGELFASWEGPVAARAEEVSFPPPDARSIFSPAGASQHAGVAAVDALQIAERQAAVVMLINAFRVRGHFKANIDPLGRQADGPHRERTHPELTLAHYGLGESDLDVVVPTKPLFGTPATARVRDILARLEAAYCGSIGAEFMNLDDMAQKLWVQAELETLPDRAVLGPAEERRVLRKLCDAENFEQLLHRRFPGTKRFSLEGGETLIPLLDMMLAEAGRAGVREVVMGMAHRGRLNVLSNTLEKPVRLIIEEFEDARGPAQGSGDVKYHLGYSADVTTLHGDIVHISLTPNPSHLEVVNAVVEGRVRAKQDRVGEGAQRLAMPVLLHGDAAFIGQGSVAEVLQLSELQGYRTGGTLHIVVNNQIGFTTAPREGRSTPYATDVARMMGIPILHVNGEDPRAVAAAVQLAVAWRQRYHRDVVIDMYCYRKHGHNEGDEPSFTQPLMYDAIRRRPTPREVYARHLTERGSLSAEEAEAIYAESRATFEAGAEAPDVPAAAASDVVLPDDAGLFKADDPDTALYLAKVDTVNPAPAAPGKPSPLKGRWEALTDGRIEEEVDTSVSRDRLVTLLTAANTFPEGFTPHAKVRRLVAQRLEMAAGERDLDWATAESAAFASLVTEGFVVRLSGQDSGRGTFSQRHAVWSDVQTGAEYFALDHLTPDQRRFHVIDSNLSEFAVLGFEYGYSLDTPDGLVLWEAQFGDFVNGAQVVIDQYITSAEQKWGRLSGLVMLLPHGYEGQGPEHSSARLERFLLQGAEDNIQVANCSTPANYFHILRRQVVRHVRKPLVIMTPKSLLRHPSAISTLDDLANGRFQRVIADPRHLDATGVRRLVFCTGRVYYELMAALAEHPQATAIAVHRVELLYPFPGDEIRALIDAAPAGAELVWCQEEPLNMGAWPMFQAWLAGVAPAGRSFRVSARPAAASPATGSHTRHKREQAALLSAALDNL